MCNVLIASGRLQVAAGHGCGRVAGSGAERQVGAFL